MSQRSEKSKRCAKHRKGEAMSDIQIALIIMVKGMAGIFAVTLVILLLVWLLGRIGTRNSSENPKQ